jgi:uncharacterized protein (UPF0332 family)
VTTEEEKRRALSLRRVKRARDHLKSARDLLAAEDLADSVSRSYYAVFQAARALLAIEGLESRKHSGVVPLFNRHFVKPGRVDKQIGAVLKDAWRQRELADYSDVAEFTRDEAERLLRDAEVFVATIAALVEAPKA